MGSDEVSFNDERTLPSQVSRRVSWPAIFAGVVVVLVVQLALSLLGIGIGASTIDPLSEQNPLAGIGAGSGVWLAFSTLIALGVGGWVAGRLAGQFRRIDGSLHGILTWGLASLIGAYMLSSAVSGLMRGTANVVGKGASLVGDGVAAMAPNIAGAVTDRLTSSDIDFSQVKNEALSMLRQSGKAELQPNELAADAQSITDDAKSTAMDAAQAPQAADAELLGLIDRVFSMGQTTLDAVDKEAMVNVLMARSNMSEVEAAATVDRWQVAAQQAQSKFEQTRDQAELKAREIGDAAAHSLAKGAIWSFISMVLGAASAAGGAALATRTTPGMFVNRRAERPLGKPAFQS